MTTHHGEREDLDALESRLRSADIGAFEPGAELPRVSRDRSLLVSIRFDREALQAVRSAARALGITQSEFIRRAAVQSARSMTSPIHIQMPLADVAGPAGFSGQSGRSTALRYASGSVRLITTDETDLPTRILTWRTRPGAIAR